MKKKQCVKCGKVKSRREFHSCEQMSDKKNSWCKDCHRKRHRDRVEKENKQLKRLIEDHHQAISQTDNLSSRSRG